MTIEEMIREKQERGYSYAMISEYSGVPVPTIQKIFSGETKSPRYDTLCALQDVFEKPFFLRESQAAYHAGMKDMPVKRDVQDIPFDRQGTYTIDDYFALPDERRVELIDGVFYDMGAPTGLHQLIAGEVHRQIANYILERGGDCMVLISPVDVQLDCDERTMVQPDVLIVCDPDKEQNGRIFGAPDFVLEVLSPSTSKKDSYLKLMKYMNAGVREYWIINPFKEKVIIYTLEDDGIPMICGFDRPIPVGIYGGKLSIDPKHILRWVTERKQKQAEGL